mgnify:CR=1 FL=1
MKVPDRLVRAAAGVLVLVLLVGVLAAAYLTGQRGAADLAERRADTLRASQVEACERGNILRGSINELTAVVDEFLRAAADARAAAGTPVDIDTAARYRSLAYSLEIVDVPDCDQAVAPVQ